MLLANAYHARVDLPAVIEASGARVRQAEVLGEDPALITLLRQRLAEAGVSGRSARRRRHRGRGRLVERGGQRPHRHGGPALAARTRWAGVEVAFATGPHPTVAEAADAPARPRAHAAWSSRRGSSRTAASPTGSPNLLPPLGIPMAEPLGSHNLVAATLLDRFDARRSSRCVAA